MKNDKVYFSNLDAIRFIAAAMVFLGHGLRNAYLYLPIQNTFLEKLLNLISKAGTGVSIFFVLSGFLITYLLISEFELNARISIKAFYIRRVLRIWPLYFAVVLFSFFLYPFFKSMMGLNNPLCSNVIYYLSFLSNFDLITTQKYHYGCDAMSQNVTWSVSVEEQFYLFWPLLFTFIPYRFWIYAIVLTIAGSIVFRIVNHNDGFVLYFHSFSVLLDLSIGGLFAYLTKRYAKFRFLFEQASTKTHLLLFTSAFCLLFWHDALFAFDYGNVIDRICISTSFAFIICAQAFTTSNTIFNLRNFSFANRWGKYTYGIYLLHPIALLMIDVVVRTVHISKENFTNAFTIGILGFILTLGLSKLSYKYFESVFLKLKDRFTIIKTQR